MGGRPPDVSDNSILKALATTDDPVLSGSEVAEAVGLGRQGAYQRLKELESRELVESKLVGGTLAWWISDEGREYLEE